MFRDDGSMVMRWPDGYPKAMQAAVLSWRLSDGAVEMDVDFLRLIGTRWLDRGLMWFRGHDTLW